MACQRGETMVFRKLAATGRFARARPVSFDLDMHSVRLRRQASSETRHGRGFGPSVKPRLCARSIGPDRWSVLWLGVRPVYYDIGCAGYASRPKVFQCFGSFLDETHAKGSLGAL